MNLKEYVQKNRSFLVIGGLAVILLIGLAYNQNFANKSTQRQVRTPEVTQAIASPSATMTTASVSGAITFSNGICHAKYINPSDSQAVLPDPSCTPGATNAAVTQNTIRTTICTVGYVETIRPPVSYTERLKEQGMRDYGFTNSIRLHEEDHFIPLELGGNPLSPKNLWPEPHATPNEKDAVESYLHQQVCIGNITLTQAQQEITKDWYNWYKVATSSGR